MTGTKRAAPGSVSTLLAATTLLSIVLAALMGAVACTAAKAQWIDGDPDSGENGPLLPVVMPEPTPEASLEDQVLAGVPLNFERLVVQFDADLRLLRNTIFARHGRSFADLELREHFASKSWYTPDPEFTPDRLTDVDRQNADLIRDIEKSRVPPEPMQVEQQVQVLRDSADSLQVLDAYLTDKAAAERGEAPPDFVLAPLSEYKRQGVSRPKTQKRK